MINHPKISLVLSSFKRAKLLEYSLLSIAANKSKYPLEIVVVNDGISTDGTKEVCERFKSQFDIKYVFTGNDENPVMRCPAIPNNVAIRKATGDILILTCPEIYHINNCIDRIVEACLGNTKRLVIPQEIWFDEKGYFVNGLKLKKQVRIESLQKRTDHVQMPFLMGIWKDQLIEIGGYDEDFIGYASEDNDLIQRLLGNGCFHYPVSAKIIHLYHGERCPEGYQSNNPAWLYNRRLLEDRRSQIVRNEYKNWGSETNKDRKTITMKGIPKILHLYWDKSPMSWLQTRTVTTFHRLNPDWEIKIYVPKQDYIIANGKYVPDYIGSDCFHLITSLPYVKLIEIDILDYQIDSHIHNILQSDIFRYNIIYKYGGVWSDFDVLWLKPIAYLINIQSVGLVPISEMGTFVCRFDLTKGHNNVSLLISVPKHPLYKFLIDKCNEIQKINNNRNKLHHQEFGTELLDKLWKTYQDTQNQFTDVVAIPYKTFYPYSIFNLTELYREMKIGRIDDEVIAIHWFNGHALSKEYVNAKETNNNCSMSKILSLLKRNLL